MEFELVEDLTAAERNDDREGDAEFQRPAPRDRPLWGTQGGTKDRAICIPEQEDA